MGVDGLGAGRIVVIGVVAAGEEGPSGGDYDQAAAYLDYRQRDSEEGQDVGADQDGED